LKLAVDATALLVPRTGVGTFAAELLKELGKRPDFEVSAFVLAGVGRHWLPGDIGGSVVELSGRVHGGLVRRLWRRLPVPNVEWLAGRFDVVHGPNYIVPPSKQAASVVSVHDVGFEHDPPMAIPGAMGHRQSVRNAIRRGAWVQTGSEYVAAEIRDIYAVSPDRVVAVPYGVRLPPPGPHPAPGAPYLLALGSTDRRKDLTTLVAAFDEVASKHVDLRLILAGPDGDAAEQLKQAISGSPHRHRIRQLGWVDDAARSSLLYGAAVVVYPSLYEGFGFVPLEAMLAGAPVVTTRVASIPEVAGDAALYVAPGDSEAMAEAIERALTDTSLAVDLVIRGRARAADFTWARTAAGMADLFQDASASR
jgi:glycosyltransferase involved in cell wall biosynthesis